MFALLARLGDLGRWDLTSIRILTSTGAALAPGQIAWMRAAFPKARIFSMYGLTECKRCTYLPADDVTRKPGSVGVAIPGNEIWLVDAADRVLGPGHAGELVVAGPTVMAGYWGRPEETAQRLRPGRYDGEVVLYTGDLCRMDEDGYLYFVGRMDDIIKSRGEKVAPAEVEAALMSVPGVVEAVVVGVPDPALGHAVKAFVTVATGSTLTSALLRDACRDRLEPFMVPQTIKIVPALHRTPNGKIARDALV
jgi:acyl-coenzyme A synthetase/AMP-(fatty) acid ligase